MSGSTQDSTIVTNSQGSILHSVVLDLRGFYVTSRSNEGWDPVPAKLESSDNTTPSKMVNASMKASIKVWMDASEQVSAHYQGMVMLESQRGFPNKFRLFITGYEVQPNGNTVEGHGCVVLPSGIDWKMEVHHFVSENAAARVIKLIPEGSPDIRKMQILLPIDDATPTQQSKAFANSMEVCYRCARVPDGTLMTIGLDQLRGALAPNQRTQHSLPEVTGTVEDELVANFLAVMDPGLFGVDDDDDDDDIDDDSDDGDWF